MLGFEIRFKDKVICAAIGEEGVLSVIPDYYNRSVVPECNGTPVKPNLQISLNRRWLSFINCTDDRI
jgi:hypothetical protein